MKQENSMNEQKNLKKSDTKINDDLEFFNFIASQRGDIKEAMQTSNEVKLDLSKNAITVLEKRYLKKNDAGAAIEKPEDMFRRVSKVMSDIEKTWHPDIKDSEIESLRTDFYNMMGRLEFLPNSPTLMNAGRELGQLSACFVLPIEDSMESIFTTLKHAALIHKSGGGTGFSFSRLRPSNDLVKSTKGVSSGPISFMEVYDAATNTVKQGGTRRGANMGILRIDHPDILDFISCKKEDGKIANFNISVTATEEFMTAVKKGTDYNLYNPRTKEPVKQLDARKIYDLIVKMAWTNGEPGIVFIDRINDYNPTPKVGEMESTNPCGEQPLLPYESCNLGSINLAKFIKNKTVDWEKLETTVKTAVRFLDNVVEANVYPIREIEMVTKHGNRKIGLGVMGWADMLYEMEIPYNSNEATQLAEEVMSFITKKGRKASFELAKIRGSFPNWELSIFNGVNQKIPIRNATVTTIAPTGTLSIIAACSGGVEPVFSLCFYRNVMDGTKLLEVHPAFLRIAKERGFYSEELMKKVSEHGSIQDIKEIPEDIRKVFVVSHDINPEWHIRMQAAFQKYTDNAVSKTVNFPNSATIEDVSKVFMLAYDLGCKGVTVYRDGSRQGQVYNIGKGEEKKTKPAGAVPTQSAKEVHDNKTQSLESLRLKEVASRAGIPFSSEIKAFRSTKIETVRDGSVLRAPEVLTVPKFIVEHINEEKVVHGVFEEKEIFIDEEIDFGEPTAQTKSQKEEDIDQLSATVLLGNETDLLAKGLCPDCHAKVEFASGCVVCRSCGFSKCG